MIYKIVILLFTIILSACVQQAENSLEFKVKEIPKPADNSNPNPIVNREQSLEAFKSTVYPIVNGQTCVACHNSQTKGQSPIFADSNAEKAFDAITMSRKVDLLTPESSRIVLKLKTQSHNCWTNSCEDDANTLLAAIQEWVKLAPPTGTETGLLTGPLKFPSDNELNLAQTEYGTLLLQAEQPLYEAEVFQGNFISMQEGSALEGNYMVLPSPVANPHTNADRSLVFDKAKFNSCKEFDATDLASSTRAVKIFQPRVHIPSGKTGVDGKVVNDGFRPFSASLGLSVIRPDKRIEYARMLYNRDFTNLSSVLFFDGAPTATPKVLGTKLPDAFQGKAYNINTGIGILPFFVDPQVVYKANGSFNATGTFTRDDGTQDILYNLFKVNNYFPPVETVHKNLIKNPGLKENFIYRKYKDTIYSWFWKSTGKKTQTQYSYSYNIQTNNIDVKSYFMPEVAIELQCPNEPIDPTKPFDAVSNPLKNCTTKPNYMKFHVVDQEGEALVQGNALDCYTLNPAQDKLVQAASASCDGENPKFFHYIDLFAHINIFEPTVYGRRTLTAYTSTTPDTYQDLETYTTNTAKSVAYNEAITVLDELDPDVFFSGSGNGVTETENLENFTSTLHAKLRTTRCMDCHGTGTPGAPQFASASASASMAVLTTGGYINFSIPSKSFRPAGMIHNCDAASTDPRYSCSNASETALREELAASIKAWKDANDASGAVAGTQTFRSLTDDERLPARAKYKFKVTEAGLYNVWAKIKRVTAAPSIYFRLMDESGNVIKYSTGPDTTTLSTNGCYKWDPVTTQNMWEWTSPGRQAELASIDQKGYLLLNDQKQPLTLANTRPYFKLLEGIYTLDVIGLSENLRIDALGINKVEDMSTGARLAFQPDRIAVDEKNISDYKRKILKYDLSNLLKLPAGKQAFFEIAVKKEYGGQNYIFQNPRFYTTPTNFNIYVRGIKVYINGKYRYPDATYNSFSGVVGDNKVLTYAPLVALTDGGDDDIQFKFDELYVTEDALSPLFPKGNPPAPIGDRRCNDLDFFIKNVKPILTSARLVLSVEFNTYLEQYPFGPRQNYTGTRLQTCTSCHNSTHPYFKMSTLLNNEEFCREAISRVDFQNFYQSVVIRGINGTGNHPKFVLVEKFVKGADNNFKVHDLTQDYMSGRMVNSSGLASNFVAGPLLSWTKEDMGITKSNYSDLTALEKRRIAFNGLWRATKFETINMEVVNYPWYVPETHAALLYDAEDPTILDNYLSSLDVIDPDPAKGKLSTNRTAGDRVTSLHGFNLDTDSPNYDLPIVGDPNTVYLKSGTKVYTPNAQPAHDPAQIDYISATPAQNTRAEMNEEFEILRDYYRETVIDWIRREHALRVEE